MTPTAPPAATPFPKALVFGLLDALARWRPQRHPWWLRAAVALLLTALAVWMRMALAPAESGGRFVTLTLAGAVCALYGGFRIGMLSAFLGAFAVNFLMVKPYFSLAIGDKGEALWLNLWFLLTQLVVVGAIGLMQRHNRLLRASIKLAERSQREMLDNFEHSATGMAHITLDGRWLRVNQTYCDLIGYPRDEFMRTHWRAFTHPDDIALDQANLTRLVRGEIDDYTLEKRYLHREGHVVWVLLSISLVRKLDGTPDYEIVVVQDITRRKLAEQALGTSERLLAQAQQLAGMASWVYDARERVFTTLGHSSQVLDLPGTHFTDLDMLARTHPDDRDMVRHRWAAAFRTGVRYDIEYRLRFGEGWHWYVVRGEFERDAQGRVTQGLGTLLDITPRKLAELHITELNASLETRIQERTQALRAAYDELESYSYAVAHDLRSPLRIINGFAQALDEDNPALTTESRKHLERIRDASKKMGELIDGLLKLAQMARGELQREPVDLSAIATRQLRELAAGEPEREVDWQVEPGLLAVADPPLVEALLQNLLHNAWKYTGGTPNARILVGRQTIDGARGFVVADNGAGFDMARAGKLFQPFQRLHLPHEFKGLGIGLATARRIVLRHGGELRAEAAPGQGARFYFTLSS